MSFYVFGSEAEYYSASSFLNVFLLLTFGVEGVYDCEGRGRRMGGRRRGRRGGEGGEGEGGISLRKNLERVFALQPHLFFYPDNKEELS